MLWSLIEMLLRLCEIIASLGGPDMTPYDVSMEVATYKAFYCQAHIYAGGRGSYPAHATWAVACSSSLNSIPAKADVDTTLCRKLILSRACSKPHFYKHSYSLKIHQQDPVRSHRDHG